ncbi:MAG: hypothetical protein Q9174_006479, partial [Haloplaca sp. 1 TL-2023]
LVCLTSSSTGFEVGLVAEDGGSLRAQLNGKGQGKRVSSIKKEEGTDGANMA